MAHQRKAVRQQHTLIKELQKQELDNNSIETEADEIIHYTTKLLTLVIVFDRDGPTKRTGIYVTLENPRTRRLHDNEDDGYRKVSEHDGPWTIHTDSGFEAAISKMVDPVEPQNKACKKMVWLVWKVIEGFEEAKNTTSDDINR